MKSAIAILKILSAISLFIVEPCLTFENFATPNSSIFNADPAPPGVLPGSSGEDEESAKRCGQVISSHLVTGGTSTPDSGQRKKLTRYSSTNSNFVAALNGIWTSARCEVSPGPDFSHRRYVFYTSSQDGAVPRPPSSDFYGQLSSRVFFRSIHFKYSDPNCAHPILAYNAEGELNIAQSYSKHIFSATPGGEEADISVYRVSLTIFNATAFLRRNYSAFYSEHIEAESAVKATARVGSIVVQKATPRWPKWTYTTEASTSTSPPNLDLPDSECDVNLLWPALAEKLPELESIEAALNTTMREKEMTFEVFNDLEPSSDWFKVKPNYQSNRKSRQHTGSLGKSSNLGRLECLKKSGFNIDELLLMRIEQKKVFFEKTAPGQWGKVKVLKVGQIFRGILGQLNYKPVMYASNLLYQYKKPLVTSVCPLCSALAQNGIEDDFYSRFFEVYQHFDYSAERYSVYDVGFILSILNPQPVETIIEYESIIQKSQRWVSTRCETRQYGVFMRRHLVFSSHSSALFRGLYCYYEDPFCKTPTYDLEIGGDFRLIKAIFNPYPIADSNMTGTPFGTAYLFNTNWARIRPRNFQAVTTLSEYSHAGNCGRASKWRLGEWQDVSQTSGCLAIGIRIPTEEIQLVRLERSAQNGTTFLYVGDVQSKRPLLPSLMAPATSGSSNLYSRSAYKGLDISLFEQIRPTSFLEPLVKCSDLIDLFNRSLERISFAQQLVRIKSTRKPSTKPVKQETTLFTAEMPEIHYIQAYEFDGQSPHLSYIDIHNDEDDPLAAPDIQVNKLQSPPTNLAENSSEMMDQPEKISHELDFDSRQSSSSSSRPFSNSMFYLSLCILITLIRFSSNEDIC